MPLAFRVFHTKINLSPDKVTDLILAACCLHNFLVEKNTSFINVCDKDVEHHTFRNGSWRSDPALVGLSPSLDRNSANSAKEPRQNLTKYFSSDMGSVPWQDNMI